jgi:hypothetical protein
MNAKLRIVGFLAVSLDLINIIVYFLWKFVNHQNFSFIVNEISSFKVTVSLIDIAVTRKFSFILIDYLNYSEVLNCVRM